MSSPQILRSTKLLMRYVLTVMFVLLLLFPLLWPIYAGFRSGQLSYRYPPIFFASLSDLTLENVKTLMTKSPQVLSGIKNSVMIASASALVCAVVATLAGYGNSRFNYRGKRLITSSSLLFYVFPPITLVIPLFILFARMGFYNSLIPLLIIYIGLTLPFNMWFMTDYINTIPRELDDQGRIDGASSFQIAYKIIFPLVLPGFGAALMYAWIIAWGEYLFALIFVQGLEKQTVSLALAYYHVHGKAPWPEIGAAIFFATMPAMVMFMIIFNSFVKGLASGALKQ